MKTFNPEKKLSEIFDEELKSSFHLDFIENKSVLGIDIYKYSEYPGDVQVYVPVLFNSLYKETVSNCIKLEKYFFQSDFNTLKEFKENFISTGDGGFQIFDNPLQSIIFASYFQFNITRFNSGSLITNLNTNLFNIIGRIELRYSITFDKIYSYDKNFFGPAIINNARILAKDNLNRLLVDYPTVNWFYSNLNTIENLMILKLKNFVKIPFFKNYNEDNKTLLFENDKPSRIKAVELLKIGTIRSKNSILEIFNLKIQIHLRVLNIKKGYDGFLVTLGNLNTKGIE